MRNSHIKGRSVNQTICQRSQKQQKSAISPNHTLTSGLVCMSVQHEC